MPNNIRYKIGTSNMLRNFYATVLNISTQHVWLRTRIIFCLNEIPCEIFEYSIQYIQNQALEILTDYHLNIKLENKNIL